MIKKLSVKNFKSIKELEIDCRRINLFIGKPNTGKSNILEALGLLSWCGYGDMPLKEYVRFQYTQNLFYDNLVDEPVEIKIEGSTDISVEITFKDNVFSFYLTAPFVERRADLSETTKVETRNICQLNYSGSESRTILSVSEFIKPYKFKEQTDFQGKESSSLMPPHGSNMFSVVMGNRKLRTSMARFFKNFGFELVLRMQDNTFEFQKRAEDKDMGIGDVIQYPYILASGTLQRIIFYIIAMESNENSTLIFEEPECHAFPYYTKYLGERIAFDEKNQYFIATHNPYLLLSILEKTPKDGVNVFITYYRDYQTKVKRLNDEEMSELMDYDPFANLDLFIEKNKK